MPARRLIRPTAQRRTRPVLEPMESRRLLATFVVETFADVTEGPAGESIVSLRNAIEQARNTPGADQIALPAGTYELALGQFTIDDPSPVTIQPLGGPVTIHGMGAGRLFEVTASSSLELIGLTLTGGRATGNGGAILNVGTLRVAGCTIAENVADEAGGALFAGNGAGTTITGSTIRGNRGSLGGGLAFSNGTTSTITTSLIENNMASVGGGGVFVRGSNSTGASSLTVTSTVIQANQTQFVNEAEEDLSRGGGLSAVGLVTLNLTTSDIIGNTAADGAGLLFTNGVSAVLTSTRVAGNVAAGDGGGIWNNGDFTATGLRLEGNVATGRGGGLFNNQQVINTTITAGSARLLAATLLSNIASDGGAAFAEADTTLETRAGSVIQGNVARNDGGAIANAGRLDVTGSTFRANTADRFGGAIATLDGGTTTVGLGSLIEQNTAGVSGGGLSSAGQLTVRDARLAGNTAITFGGGLVNGSSGVLSLTEVTIEGNVADAGGGLFNAGATTIEGSTITQNRALVDGGGLHNLQGTLTVTASRVEANRAPVGGGLQNFGTTSLFATTVSQNQATSGNGGGIATASPGFLFVRNGSRIEANTATGRGGGLAANGPATIFEGSVVAGNSAPFGGGIAVAPGAVALGVFDIIVENNTAQSGGGLHTAGEAVLSRNTFRNNRATDGDGGAIAVAAGGTLQMTVSGLVEGNSATGNGGGIALAGTTNALNITGVTFRGNQAANGGGLFHDAPAALFLLGSVFETNTAVTSGGGVATNASFVSDGLRFQGNQAVFGGGFAGDSASVVTLNDATFEGNTAGNAGGAVSNAGVLAMSQGVVRNNTSGNVGGGLANRGTATIAESLFEDNAATIAGGAASSFQPVAWLNVLRSQFLRNRAQQGGALWVAGDSRATVVGSTIQQNSAGNGGGIYLDTITPSRIGGTTPGDDNLITVNSGNGLEIRGRNTSVLRNTILGNTGDGVRIVGGRDNTIGQPGQANNISNNGGAGVAVVGPTATGNAIRGNSISRNGGLGIDLGGDGPTANDPLDVDSGPNQVQNTPTIQTFANGSTTRVVGSIQGVPNSVLTIDFYGNNDFPAPDYGEGQFAIGSITVTTDAGGQAAFDIVLPTATSPGTLVTATATDALGNTSEFSLVTPQHQLLGLREQVRGLITDGTLTTKQAKKLLDPLDAAERELRRNRPAAAIKQVNDFILVVNDYVQRGILTSAVGSRLVDRANLLIHRLQSS